VKLDGDVVTAIRPVINVPVDAQILLAAGAPPRGDVEMVTRGEFAVYGLKLQ
jgi:hypothetical protein